MAYKPSGVVLRAPPVRQQANGHAGGVHGPLKYEVTIKLSKAVHQLAAAAAKRRHAEYGGQMTIETLCSEIVIGVICRGSITGTLRAFGDYAGDGRCGGNYGIAAPLENADEESAEV